MQDRHWTTLPHHRAWLSARADDLFSFFEPRAINPKGGFFDFDKAGRPLGGEDPVRAIHMSARMVHCFVAAHLMGRPGAADIIDHGMDTIWNRHRDVKHGGYWWSVGNDGPVDASKQGYGHAFVLLAAAGARLVNHPLADAMLADITEILETKFWEPRHGAIAEEFSEDWQPVPGYRGQNSNMHLTESLMAAFEATGKNAYLDKALSIADLVINRKARETGWRVGEHFSEDWVLDKNYRGNEMFRPSGTTPGHALEWARLVLQLHALTGGTHAWMSDAAQGLFAEAMRLGWDADRGGLYYTLDWEDRPAKRIKLWWPMAEAAAAAHFLNHHCPSAFHEQSYRTVWNGIQRHFIDHAQGGWHEELTEDMVPATTIFPGKGDIYHALQACLIPLYPAKGSLTAMIAQDC